MTGHELFAELKHPGQVWMWVPALDDYVVVMKAALRNTLEALDLDDIECRAYRIASGELCIDDFLPDDEALARIQAEKR